MQTAPAFLSLRLNQLVTVRQSRTSHAKDIQNAITTVLERLALSRFFLCAIITGDPKAPMLMIYLNGIFDGNVCPDVVKSITKQHCLNVQTYRLDPIIGEAE